MVIIKQAKVSGLLLQGHHNLSWRKECSQTGLGGEELSHPATDRVDTLWTSQQQLPAAGLTSRDMSADNVCQ